MLGIAGKPTISRIHDRYFDITDSQNVEKENLNVELEVNLTLVEI